MSLLDIEVVVMPLVFPVLIGWVMVQVGLAKVADAKVLTTLFLYVAAPALLIVTLASEDIDDLFKIPMLLTTLVGFIVVYAAVFAVYRLLLRRELQVAAFAGLTASGFNALAIGLPVMLGIFGRRAVVPVVIATVLFLAILVPLTLTLVGLGQLEGDESATKAFKGALLTTAKNPIMIATAIGIVLSALNVTLPTVVENSFTTLGNATVLLALVAVGMTIEIADLRSGGAEMLWLAAVRSFVAPAIVMGIALTLGASDFFGAALVILFAQPTAKTVFVLSEDTGVFQREAAGVVALTTVAAIVVLPIWVIITDHVWAGAFT